jgi:hypothetical protein
MPVSGLHRQIAALALAAAGEHGFALGGGNALLAHGVISRPIQDAGLFTGQEHGVQAAAGAVEAARRAAGFRPERKDQAAGLTGIFPGTGEGLAASGLMPVTAPPAAIVPRATSAHAGMFGARTVSTSPGANPRWASPAATRPIRSASVA